MKNANENDNHTKNRSWKKYLNAHQWKYSSPN